MYNNILIFLSLSLSIYIYIYIHIYVYIYIYIYRQVALLEDAAAAKDKDLNRPEQILLLLLMMITMITLMIILIIMIIMIIMIIAISITMNTKHNNKTKPQQACVCRGPPNPMIRIHDV